jgi:hypothetical protein
MKSITIAGVVGLMLMVAGQATAKPLKVYILAGQSNMQGHSMKSTLSYMADDPKTKTLYDRIMDADGKPCIYDQVRVAAFSEAAAWGNPKPEQREKTGPLTVGFGGDLNNPDKFGPELGFGIAIYEKLGQPILIIKLAWGGRSLIGDFRPPSSVKPDDLAETKVSKEWIDSHGDAESKKWKMSIEEIVKLRETSRGRYYGYMVERVKQVLADLGKYHPAYDKSAGCEIAGFVWFQGFNDLVSGKDYQKYGGHAAYGEFLACLIRDLRKDLSAPAMPVVIGVIGVGGKIENMPEKSRQSNEIFRKAMAAPAAMPEFKGRVVAVETAEYWPVELDAVITKAEILKKQADRERDEKKKSEPNLKPKELAAWRQKRCDELMNEKLTADERRILGGASNFGFHYHGCGKFFGQIGEAFANAMHGIK